jgi:hypothetical protein
MALRVSFPRSMNALFVDAGFEPAPTPFFSPPAAIVLFPHSN